MEDVKALEAGSKSQAFPSCLTSPHSSTERLLAQFYLKSRPTKEETNSSGPLAELLLT
jgi:hypothetical protein